MFDDYDTPSNDWYDVAQICMNGHVINDCYKERPIHNKKFCDKCGGKTITACPQCSTAIQGFFHVSNVFSMHTMEAPRHCSGCGAPYPWTEKKLKLAKELAAESDNLTGDEKALLSKSLDDLLKNSPESVVASMRFKKLMLKAGKETAGALREILIDIVSESAKKAIWGPAV